MSTPTTLLASAKCYECLPPGHWQLLKLGLLKQILLVLSPMADTSANALMEQAKCYACMSPGLWQLLELGLLKAISDAGLGGTGGGSISHGVGAPTTAPDGGAGLYIDDSTDIVWIYKPSTGTWVELMEA